MPAKLRWERYENLTSQLGVFPYFGLFGSIPQILARALPSDQKRLLYIGPITMRMLDKPHVVIAQCFPAAVSSRCNGRLSFTSAERGNVAMIGGHLFRLAS